MGFRSGGKSVYRSKKRVVVGWSIHVQAAHAGHGHIFILGVVKAVRRVSLALKQWRSLGVSLNLN